MQIPGSNHHDEGGARRRTLGAAGGVHGSNQPMHGGRMKAPGAGRVNGTSINGASHVNGAGINGTAVNGTAINGGAALRFEIPSRFEAIREPQQRIMEGVETSGFDPESVFAIRIALEEALVNAIKHGNCMDPAKKVRVCARVTPGRAEIVVEDEGTGFSRACIADPTAEENLLKCSGRGILLIESYMTRVHWSKGGRRVRMVKTKESPEAGAGARAATRDPHCDPRNA